MIGVVYQWFAELQLKNRNELINWWNVHRLQVLMRREIMSEGYYIHTKVLFRIAKTSYERTISASTDNTGGQDDALVSILFSAATLESFVSEIAIVSETVANFDERLRVFHDVASIINEAEESRSSTILKFILAKAV